MQRFSKVPSLQALIEHHVERQLNGGISNKTSVQMRRCKCQKCLYPVHTNQKDGRSWKGKTQCTQVPEHTLIHKHTRTHKVLYLVQQAGLGNETSGFCLRGKSRKRDLSPNAAVATGSQCVCVYRDIET